MELHKGSMACPHLFFFIRRQAVDVLTEDVVLTNIRSSDDGNGIDFDMYVENTESMVLNQQALLQAVMVSTS